MVVMVVVMSWAYYPLTTIPIVSVIPVPMARMSDALAILGLIINITAILIILVVLMMVMVVMMVGVTRILIILGRDQSRGCLAGVIRT